MGLPKERKAAMGGAKKVDVNARRALPAMHELAGQAGIELPSVLGKIDRRNGGAPTALAKGEGGPTPAS